MRNKMRIGLSVVVSAAFIAAAACQPGGASEEDMVTVPSETSLSLTLQQDLSTENSSAGDGFTATVASDWSQEGQVVVPAGATVHGKVTAVQEAGDGKPAAVKLDFERLEVEGDSYDIQARLTSANPVTRSKTRDEARKIGGGAAAGAVLGAIISGEPEGAVIGAAAGAAGGTAVTLGTREQHAYLPKGSTIDIQLTEGVQVLPPEEG